MVTRLTRLALTLGVVCSSLLASSRADAQEPAACLSPNPADWPAAAKPYFLLTVDTSGSMLSAVGNPAIQTSCNFGTDRRAHARCAVRNTIQAFAGQANFGLATFAVRQTGCSNTCFNNCDYDWLSTNPVACGPGSGTGRRGANIVVPMLRDIGAPATNVPDLLSWVDNSCGDNREIFADGNTPLNGTLRDAFRYYSNEWVPPSGIPGSTLASPLTSVAAGERACRSVNVILITDGDETCDSQADAVDAAADLLTGFTKDGITWSVRTHVINFAGGTQANTNAIAAAGGTGSAYLANNENELAIALSNIIASTVRPETCDNTDNNCNGCTDEGYRHYCNVEPVAANCCAWTTPAQRTACITSYQTSITPGNPTGNLALLPCTTVAQSQQPSTWLCFNPGDLCDNVDNNCFAGVDENQTKCGNPLHCPTAEVCNGLDDNCNGAADEGIAGCNCQPSPEICDGCDNDCNGIADDGLSPVACGLASPPNCAGTRSCNPPQAVPVGGCVAGGGFGNCTNNPQSEACDGVDNDCDGVIDNGINPQTCVPPGTPGNLVYGGTSQCRQGSIPCGGTCTGFVGPSPEVCDGIDNDCDGTVDEGSFGVGQQCGANTPPCSPGATACVNGALVCQGGIQPQDEICNGVDDNCNGQTDEQPLVDAPLPGQNGCWQLPGVCCTHEDLSWCPPAGATCNTVGSLSAPCNTGTLVCAGPQGWVCQGGTAPQGEVCDGIDNNCNATIDEGPFPQEGQPCGTDEGECNAGVIDCQGGALDCVGDTGPIPELCNGLDDDCDGTIDNGIPTGGPCTAMYDMLAYPGPRTALPCQPGVLACNGNGGLECIGGVGPSPEICDGIDNDCDGAVDEVGGMAPDFIDGSENPNPPPDAAIGETCGTEVGACTEGAWGCVNGIFQCLGSTTATPESCDCEDNDCDGSVDNPNPNNNPPLCSAGKDCVKSSEGCQCAAPCGSPEFPCPAGQVCQTVTNSQTGQPLGDYCVVSTCNDCASQTKTDAMGNVLCAPKDAVVPGCSDVPECVCKGQNGCQPPCFGVTCDTPLLCTNVGPNPGTCAPDNCFNQPCAGCDRVCNDATGLCVGNPCEEDSCPDGTCRPSEDFTTPVCAPSCAGVMCGTTEVCKDGVCVASCDPPCIGDTVCDLAQTPPTCVQNQCTADACPNGGCCDPLTGACGNCPCEGVICPDGQRCQNDECVLIPDEGTGGAGGSTSATGPDQTVGSGSGSAAAGGGTDDPRGVWGLATGGSGCACRVASPASDASDTGKIAAFVAIAIAVARRRRRSASTASEVVR